VAGNCSFEYSAPGSSYSRLCRQLLVQSCNKTVCLRLHDLHRCAPFLVNMSIARGYDGSLNRTALLAGNLLSASCEAGRRRMLDVPSIRSAWSHALPRQAAFTAAQRKLPLPASPCRDDAFLLSTPLKSCAPRLSWAKPKLQTLCGFSTLTRWEGPS
jgi:hypothetical protein